MLHHGFMFLLFCSSSSHHETIVNKSQIICDGGIVNDSCIDKTIICPNGFDCHIFCDISSNQSRTLLSTNDHTECIIESYGCCGTNIYCPYGKKCDIICSGGCRETIIHGRNASYVEVKHCDQSDNTNYWSTCHDMTIYCPFHGPCEFEGNYALQASYIHTLHGFDDIYLEANLLMHSSVIFCGVNGNESHCLSNDKATQCSNIDDNICEYNISEQWWYYNESSSESLDESSINTTENIEAKNINVINSFFDWNNKLQMFSYGVVILLLFVPIITVFIAIIYHMRLKGSDSPEYMSIFKCFINISDLYTDIIFCFILRSNSNKLLFYIAVSFTILSHIISIVSAMWCVHKWREYRIAFIKKYDNLVIGLTVLAGFVPTIELLSSKLFYASRLTLQISDIERLNLQQFRFINNNILENIPLIIIQILTVTSTNEKSDINPITLIAFCFSALSVIIGMLTLISRCLFIKHIRNWSDDKLIYKLDIKSVSIETRHYYCHKLFAKSLCHAMETNDGRIETIEIVPIVDGISCKIEIISHYKNHENIHQILNEIGDNKSDTFDDFKSALKKTLSIIECDDLNVIITKLDRYGDVIREDEIDNDMPKLRKRGTYMPLRQTSTSSSSMKSFGNTNITNTYAHRLSVSSCGDIIGEPSVVNVVNSDNNSNINSVISVDGNNDTNNDIKKVSWESVQSVEMTENECNSEECDMDENIDEDDIEEENDDIFSINAVNGSRCHSYEYDLLSNIES